MSEYLICHRNMSRDTLNPVQCTALFHEALVQPTQSDLTPHLLALFSNTKACPIKHRHVPHHPESLHHAQIHSTIPRNIILLIRRQKCTAHRLASKTHSCTTVHRHALQQRRASNIASPCRHRIITQSIAMPHNAQYQVTMGRRISCHMTLPTVKKHAQNMYLFHS